MNNFKDLGYYERVNDIIDSLELKNKTDNDIIKNRFLYEVLLYEQKRDNTKKYYNAFRFIVTVGSIFLPAILSIGQMDPAKLPRNFDTISYWTSWTISLTVTACNGFLQLFSLDKNYFNYSLTVEQLKTEGWQYFQLSGKYENAQNHGQAFKQFCKSVEGVKRKQIEQEYNGKGEDKKNKFNFSEELKDTLPPQFQPKQIEAPTTNPSSTLDTLLDVGDSVTDLKQSLKGSKKSLTDTTDIAIESVDRSLETMEEGNPTNNKPTGNKPIGNPADKPS